LIQFKMLSLSSYQSLCQDEQRAVFGNNGTINYN